MAASEDIEESGVESDRRPRTPPPERMGDYKRGARLGRGGMGMVYEAEDLQLRRTAAIKVLSPALAQSAENLERLKQEAQVAARLDHPNIVRIFAFGIENDFPYIAMERLRGRDLGQTLLEGGPVEPARALRMIREAAEALKYAWEHNLIHRDIKPSNLFLTEGGEIKVMDFGLVRRMDSSARLTKTGIILGTPGYMSPEQVRNSPTLDFRSDMYSLGLTFYALLAGTRPFPEETPMGSTVRLASEGLPVPRAWDAIARGRLTAILRRMTRKERDERYASWEEAIVAMRALEADFAAGTADKRRFPIPLPSARNSIAVTCAVCSLALAAVAIRFAATGGPASGMPTHKLHPEYILNGRGERGEAEAAEAAETRSEAISETASGAPGEGAQEAGAGPPLAASQGTEPEAEAPVGSQAWYSAAARAGRWERILHELDSADGLNLRGPGHDARYAVSLLPEFETGELAARVAAGDYPDEASLREARLEAARAVLRETGEGETIRSVLRPLLYLSLRDAPDAAAQVGAAADRLPPDPSDPEMSRTFRIINGSRDFIHGGPLVPPR